MPAFVDGWYQMSNASTAPIQINRRYADSRSDFDFDNYLLSGSPPTLGWGVSYKPYYKREPMNAFRELELDMLQPQNSANFGQRDTRRQILKNTHPVSNLSKTKLASSETDGHTYADAQNALDSEKEKTGSGKVERVKKVSFADDYGISLTQVKYFSETPDMPPIIKTKAMSWGSRCYSLPQNTTMSLAASAGLKPVLMPDFAMPVSNQMTFQKKLQQLGVALQSLYVTANSILTGTIQVKNLGFEKTVFVRCTFNSWQTSTDITCSYKPPSFLEEVNLSCDLFSFTINVPSEFDTSKRAEFAVCFRCSGNEHWDNNNGANYQLISSNRSTQGMRNNHLSITGSGDVRKWSQRPVTWPFG